MPGKFVLRSAQHPAGNNDNAHPGQPQEQQKYGAEWEDKDQRECEQKQPKVRPEN
jgi:hypothetical protein